MSDKTGFFFRPMLGPTLVALVFLPILIALGTWQVERLHWKEALIATVEQRMAAPPISLPPASTWSSLDLKAFEYSKLALKGRFRPEIEFHYFTQDDDGTPGYAVISPFDLDTGGTILIDRGFVSADLKDPVTRPSGQVSGEQSIIAVLRAAQPRGLFDGADDVVKNIWYVRDPVKMAAQAGLKDTAPFLANLQAPVPAGDWPKPRSATVQLPNSHLQYAITWYGFALIFLVIYLIYHMNNGRLGFRRR